MKHIIAVFAIGSATLLAGCSVKQVKACKPPRPNWRQPHNFVGLAAPMMEVSLTRDGSIYWNGVRISAVRFGRYLTEVHNVEPKPTVFLQTEMGVSCQTLEALRDQMERTLDCRDSYPQCAEGIHAVWRNLPTAPGEPVS